MLFKQSRFYALCTALVLLGSAGLSAVTAYEKVENLSQLLVHKTFTDSEVRAISCAEGAKFLPGQLVLVRKAPSAWIFGKIQKQLKNETFDIQTLHQATVYRGVKKEALKAVLPFWRYLYQPTQNITTFEQIIDGRLAGFKKHGVASGHGMIIPAGSKIAVIGDLHGSYGSLQNHLLELHNMGLLDNNFKLSSDCYVICLGDYVGFGSDGVEVVNILLRLQEANPGHVFLLAGDHEEFLKDGTDGFKKEFFEKFCTDNQDETIQRVWQKFVNLCLQLPRVLLVGLQMPSTHNYDFLVFCHSCFERNWRPQNFMQSIVKNHIDNNYKSSQVLSYYDGTAGRSAFISGEFSDENSSATKKSNGTAWTKSAFEDFVQRHASCFDSKYMYHCCLCAILRGHEHVAGGLVKLDNTGLKAWKRLKNNKLYEILPYSIFTCISGSQGIARFKSHDNAFGIVQAGQNGHWYITSYCEQI
jgi:hypothetical protein